MEKDINAIDMVRQMVADGQVSQEVAEKYFPELKESEDERIRKAILELVHDTTGDSLWVDYNVHKENALAWLEKRGQTFTKKDVDDAYLKGISDTKNELEKQGEPKPVPAWMPKFLDELRSKKNYFDWDENKDMEGGILAIINWMNPNYFNRKDVEQTPADKVEPKFKVGDIMRSLEEAKEGITDGLPVVVSIDEEYYHCNNELISIKDQDKYEYPPMNRKQKPDWSEETLLDNLIYALANDRIGNNRDEYVNWLKSLKDRVQPQNWKPSDELMAALNYVVNLMGSSESPTENDLYYNILKSLREQLKKLTE